MKYTMLALLCFTATLFGANLFYYNHGQKVFLTPEEDIASRSVGIDKRFRTDRGEEITIGTRLSVKLKKGAKIDPILKTYGLKLIKKMGVGGLYLLQADSVEGAINVANALHRWPTVLFAQPDIAKKRRLR